MFINYLLRNKKSRKSLRFRRKIVESYRAELVEALQFQQRLHLSWAKLRRLNRWYFKHRLEPYLHPKCRIRSMKNNAAYLKQLERKLADLEKENQLLRLKAEAYETVIQIAEEQFNIPIVKKSGAKRSKS